MRKITIEGGGSLIFVLIRGLCEKHEYNSSVSIETSPLDMADRLGEKIYCK